MIFVAGGTLTALMGYLDSDPHIPSDMIRRRAHEGVDRTLTTPKVLGTAES